MNLYEREPAQRFDDAHLLGNGRLGASVYGGVPFEEILINDDTLWSGSESYRVNEEYYDYLKQAQALALKGEVKKAYELINDHMEGSWSQAYMPLGSALICVGQKDARRNMPFKHVLHPEVSDYRRTLDLDTATETVTYHIGDVSYKREYFVSKPRELIYVRLSAEGGPLDFSVTLDSPLKHSVKVEDGQVTLSGIAPDFAEPSYNPVRPTLIYYEEDQSDALRFAARARIISTDGNVSFDRDRFYVAGASYAVLMIAAGTNYAGFEKPRDRDVNSVIERLNEQLNAAAGWPEALHEHIEDYRALYSRVTLDLGEEISGSQPTSTRFKMNAEGVFDPSVAALAAQYARYLLISGSRPGTQAENLQGIWNDRIAPPWSSNYTTNINVQMNYWPAELFALSECHEPMFDLVRECAESGKRAARDYYHLDGWVAHHNVDLWRMCVPACEDASFFFWPFGGAWMCQHLWTHYEYTLDETFLKEVAYPVIREAARFMLGYLCEDEDGRHLTIAPSTSPENKFIAPGSTYRDVIADVNPENRFSADKQEISAVSKGSCMDMTIIRELFYNTLHAEEILGIDHDALSLEMQEALPRLSPYKIGKTGALQEWFWDYEECTPGMGHMSHLYSVYPANIINERDFPEEYRAAYVSLMRRRAHGGLTIQWPGAWALCLAARFYDRVTCTSLLASMTESFTSNLLVKDYIQIDAIFGFAAGIGEMLLQSHRGFIELLPTPAYGWVNGSFSGLRARGGFECALTWHDYAPCAGSIRSLLGRPCQVKAQGLKGVRLPDGEFVPAGEDGLVRFDTARDAVYELVF